MQNKFSNCFVWVGPSTSDLKFPFLHEDTSADHPFIIKRRKSMMHKGLKGLIRTRGAGTSAVTS